MENATKHSLNNLNELLANIARQPVAGDLWKLRGALLAYAAGPDQPDAQLASDITREFFLYLSEIRSKMTARQYNELASKLDVGAVGVLALQDILLERENLWQNLALGGLGEGLMVIASRQYVKAWEKDLDAVHRRAAWILYEVLWQLSGQYQPDMDTGARQALIERTLTPALADETPFESRMLLLLRLFQTVLLLAAAPLCSS
jgi:hypothetical protein